MLHGTMPWEIEVGEKTVAFEVDYAVSPGEPERGPSYSSGGEPGYGPGVEDCRVFYCPEARDPATGKMVPKRDAAGKRIRERRPELDDLVTDEEVIDYALGREADRAEASEEARADAARDERRYPNDAGRGASTSTGFED